MDEDMKILFPTTHLFRNLLLPLLPIKTLPAFDLHHEATTTGIIVHVTHSYRPSDNIANEHLASCTYICTWAKFNEIGGTCPAQWQLVRR